VSAIVRLRDVRFAYAGTGHPVFEHLDWEIGQGSFTLLTGPSGSGKSTMLRVLNGLVPHFSGGAFGGDAIIAGRDIRTHAPRQMSDVVGFVFQDPEPQMISDRVDDEICFSLEQRGVARSEMRRRLEDVLDVLGIAHLRERSPQTLSGGEQQRVAIASALALRPNILVLDEPTSQLDPGGAEAVIEAIARLHDDYGMTVIVSEHRLERLMHRADRIRGIDAVGSVRVDDIPRIAAMQLVSEVLPPVTRLARTLTWSNVPLTLNEMRRHDRYPEVLNALARKSPSAVPTEVGDRLIQVQDVSVTHGKNLVLRGIDLSLGQAEVVAIMGRNGSGKTTLLRAMLGFQQIASGLVLRDSNLPFAYLPQQPGSVFFHETVAEEIGWTLRQRASPKSVADVLAEFELSHKAASNPRDLSGGERERAAMAAVLAGDPPLIVLDEPTRGMDAFRKRELAGILRLRQQGGALILLSTHDVELVAALATRVIVLGHGEIISDGHPREVLAGSISLSPQINRLLGSTWLTVEDILATQLPQ
jgi:energy-coupling factor transport system ATP-binding protein